MTEQSAIQVVEGGVVDAAPTLPADPMISMIERVLMSPDLPMDRITSVIDLRERQMNKEAEQAFNAAFAGAMADMPDVPRTGDNGHLKRKYSTLDDLIRTTRPVLSKHGLSLNWQTGLDGEGVWVKAVVRHALGHSIETTQSGPRDKSGSMNVLQGGGSAETYLKRYTGFAILGLSSGEEVEDDGQQIQTVNEEQFKVLRYLIERTGTDERKFHTAYGAKNPDAATLHEFPASLFEKAKAQLERKLEQAGGNQ